MLPLLWAPPPRPRRVPDHLGAAAQALHPREALDLAVPRAVDRGARLRGADGLGDELRRVPQGGALAPIVLVDESEGFERFAGWPRPKGGGENGGPGPFAASGGSVV